jgi:hypothetical protein
MVPIHAMDEAATLCDRVGTSPDAAEQRPLHTLRDCYQQERNPMLLLEDVMARGPECASNLANTRMAT